MARKSTAKTPEVPKRFLQHRAVHMKYENDFEVQARLDDHTLEPLVRTYDGNRFEIEMSPADAERYAYALINRAALAREMRAWEIAHGTKPRKR